MKILDEAAVSGSWTGNEGFISGMVRSHGWQVDTSFPLGLLLSLHMGHLTKEQPACLRAIDPRQWEGAPKIKAAVFL